jgi:hypothetical protein
MTEYKSRLGRALAQSSPFSMGRKAIAQSEAPKDLRSELTEKIRQIKKDSNGDYEALEEQFRLHYNGALFRGEMSNFLEYCCKVKIGMDDYANAIDTIRCIKNIFKEDSWEMLRDSQFSRQKTLTYESYCMVFESTNA